MQQHLVIMAKAPRMGRVKTRLARDIGTVGAWSFYRHTLAAVARPLIADRRWQTWLCVSPDRSIGAANQWPLGGKRIAQGQGDLGERMARVMRALPPGPVVLIGALKNIPATARCGFLRELSDVDDGPDFHALSARPG